MNKLLRYSFVLLLAFICGSINAGTIVFSELGLVNGVQYSDPFDGGDFTVTFGGGGNDGKYYNTGTGIRVYGGGTMTIAAKSGNLTKIVITYDGSNKPADGTVVDGGSYDAESGTWTGSAASVVFTRPSGSGHWRVQSVEATIGGGQSQTKIATTIEFSGDYLTKFTPGKDGDKADLPTAIVKAADAAVEGATVTWSLTKGSNWSADSDPVINGTKIEFGDHSRGDLTLKASYEGNDSYEASNKTYTLKVYKGYMAIKSILEDYPVVGGDTWKAKEAEWKAGTPISYWQVDAKSESEFTSKEALVTYVNGQYTYIKDNDGCLLLYGSSLGFNKGDKISGDLGENQIGAIYGTLKAYNGLLELATTKDDIEFVVKSSDNAVEAKTITIDQLTQENMNEYLKIENAEYVSANGKNVTFKVGDANVAVYNQFNVDITALVAGAMYDLYGMGCIYYKNEVVTPQLYLVAFEEATGGATESGVIYSWESPEGTVIETGGSATYENGETDPTKYRVNYANAGYYTICVNGKKGNMGDAAGSANGGFILVTLDSELKADDAIALTGYINKNESKEASIFFQFDKGDGVNDDYIFGDADNIDTTIGGKINTHVFKVPASADGSKNFKMSRNKAGTNIFLTKLVITRGGATGINTVENVRINNGAIYNLAGQKVGKDYKGIVIINGKKFVVK